MQQNSLVPKITGTCSFAWKVIGRGCLLINKKSLYRPLFLQPKNLNDLKHNIVAGITGGG